MVLPRIFGRGAAFGAVIARPVLLAPLPLPGCARVAAAKSNAGPYVYHPESKSELSHAAAFYPGSAHVRRTRQKAISLHGHRSRQLPFCANKAQGQALRRFCAKTSFLLTVNGHFLFDGSKRKWGFIPARQSRASSPPQRTSRRLTPCCAPASTGGQSISSAGGHSPPWPAGRHRRPPRSAAPWPGSGPCTARPAP